MPWKESTVKGSKLAFVEAALKPGVNFSALCRHHGISRECGYKTLKQYKENGQQGLDKKSKRPNNSPNKTSLQIENLILAVRQAYPRWGAEKIRAFLMKQGHVEMPTEKTIDRILKRNGCINPEESAKRKKYIRFEHDNPNDLWQMDFKGHFKVGKQTCYPLTLLDDHSRFSLAIVSCANQQRNTVINALIDVFRLHGLPKRMTMDNGPPWGYSADQRYTVIDIWLMRLGIRVSHSRPYHPQTQGKLERFHRTLKLELLSDYYFDDLQHAQEGFDWWRTEYNEIRPHQAINFNVPSDRYIRSEQVYPETLSPIEYASDLDVRKVDTSARVRYKGCVYKIGKGLIGEYVGLKDQENNDQMLDVYYCQQKVLELVKL